MEEGIKFYVGVDAHKESLAVAACEAGSREAGRFVGTVRDLRGLLKVLGKAGKGTMDPGDYRDPHPTRSAVVRQAAAVLLGYPDREAAYETPAQYPGFEEQTGIPASRKRSRSRSRWPR